MNSFPDGWVPDTVVMEGMFLINTPPLPVHSTMKEYAWFVLRRFAHPYFFSGTKEVHIVFDNPWQQPHTPKSFEQSRRDAAQDLPVDHQHVQFGDDSKTPVKWREFLNCRVCKRSLVVYLGSAFTHCTPAPLNSHQELTVAECFEGEAAIAITSSGVQERAELSSDAEETDTRVWLHAFRGVGHRKLVFSPDTDVYHIGLPLLDTELHDVYVQLSPATSPELRLLHLNGLCQSLASDPDLALVPYTELPKIIQSLYISTGCDYVSFFPELARQVSSDSSLRMQSL